MSRKMFVNILALLVIASLALAACQPTAATETAAVEPTTGAVEPTEPAAEATEPAAEPEATEPAPPAGTSDLPYESVDPAGQEVLFWHQHTGDREEALLEIVNEFNSTNEWGITVTAENQGGYGDIFNKMLPILNTQDVPSLVVAYQNQAATYQLADALVDMNGMVNSPTWGLSEEEQSDFFPGFFTQDVFPNFGNARLAFPPNRSMEVLYYNQDWLTELGYDAPPQTPDEFKEMACAAAQTPFSKSSSGSGMGYQLSLDASRFASWAFAFGGDVFDYDAGQYDYSNDASVAAMTFLQDLFEEGCATIVTEDFGDQTDFGAGNLMFTVGSSSGLPFYRSAVDEGAQFNWGVAAIPYTTSEPVMNVYGASVSIPKSNPEEELAAWLFVKYYTSTDVQAKWAEASQYFPVRASVAEGLADYFEAEPAYKTAFDMLEYGYYEPPTPGYDFVRTMVEEAMAEIVAEPYPEVQPILDRVEADANVNLEEQLSQMQ